MSEITIVNFLPAQINLNGYSVKKTGLNAIFKDTLFQKTGLNAVFKDTLYTNPNNQQIWLKIDE